MNTQLDRINFQLYGLWDRLRHVLTTLPWRENTAAWQEEIRRQQQRISSQRFRVAVVGEFKRGKSSLINTLLERDILPADVLPTTATFNRVIFGDTPRVFLHMKDGSRRSVPIDELSMYITKLNDEAQENARSIQEAVVEFPSMFCRNGIELIDTPGLNDEEEMTERTVSQLQEIDLAIVAVSAAFPFSQSEANLVVQLLETSSVCQILFAVTMIDLIDEEDHPRLMDTLRTRIRENVLEQLQNRYQPGDSIFEKYEALLREPRLYGLSARDAGRGRRLQDTALFARSGYLQFTRELPSILLATRGRDLMRNALRVLEKTLSDIQNAVPQRIAEIAKQREYLQKIKPEVGAQLYGSMRDEHSAWLKQAEALAEDIRSIKNEVTNCFMAAWSAEHQSNEERVGHLLEALPIVYRKINERIDLIYSSRLQTAVDSASAAAVEPALKKVEELLGETPALREQAAAALSEGLPVPRISTVVTEVPKRARFYWERSPVPLHGNNDWLNFARTATGFSIDKCIERNKEELEQIVEKLSENRQGQFQALVVFLFKLFNTHDAALQQEADLLQEMDGLPPIQELQAECAKLREAFDRAEQETE